MPTGGFAPRVTTLAEREAARGNAPPVAKPASPLAGVRHPMMTETKPAPAPVAPKRIPQEPYAMGAVKPEAKAPAAQAAQNTPPCMFRVEKGVPMPEDNRRGRSSPYPWDSLEVGDSFLIPLPLKVSTGLSHSAGKKRGKRFTQRKVADGVRVWRTV